MMGSSDEERQKLDTTEVAAIDCGASSQGKASGDDSNSSDGAIQTYFHFADSTRYFVILLATCCLSLTMSNSVALNFTVICMNKEEGSGLDGESANSTNVRPMFNNTQRAILFSAVPVGTLLGTLPITPLVSKLGMRKTFVIYGLVSAMATLFTPVSASLHFGVLLLMRVLQGIAVSICFPASGAIIADWSPLRSAGTFVALLSCHIQFGSILTMPLAGELCESRWGWPAVYYVQAFFTAVAFGAFFMFFRDSPRIHRNVSQKELSRIEQGKPPLDANPERNEIPYKAMLRDSAVWGVFLCSMGSTFGFYVFMQYGPIYLNKTLKFDVERTGFATALPALLSVCVKFVVGPVSDYATCVSDRFRVLMFATASQFLVATCFCALALLPADSPPLLLQGFFTAVTVVSGMNCAGVGKSTQLISRQFAHIVTTFSVFACSVTIIIIPVLVSTIAPDNEPSQWSRIFLLVAAVVIVCMLFFDFTAEASPRPWTFSKRSLAGRMAAEQLDKNRKFPTEKRGRLLST